MATDSGTAKAPDEVEPSTATSQLKQGNLVLMVKRANGTSQNAKAAGQ